MYQFQSWINKVFLILKPFFPEIIMQKKMFWVIFYYELQLKFIVSVILHNKMPLLNNFGTEV